MLFYNVLTDQFHLFFTVLSFILLGFATLYCKNLKYAKGLWQIFAGFCLLLIVFFFKNYEYFFLTQGVSVVIFILFQMLMILCVSLLFMLASSHILVFRPLSINVLFSTVTLGLLIILYAVLFANDALFIKAVCQILPLIGLTYVFLSFISKPNLRAHKGEILSAIAVFGFMAAFVFEILFGVSGPWYFPVICLNILAFSYLVTLAETLEQNSLQFQQTNAKNLENLEQIIRYSPLPVLLSKLSDDTLLFANINAVKLFEINPEELGRYKLKDFFVDTQNRRLLTEKLEKSKSVTDFELLVKTTFGNTPFWLSASASVIDFQNNMALYLTFQDISSRKARESLLQNQAERDPLTSVYNRRYFEQKAAEKILKAAQNKTPFAVLMIDADHFKNVNDTYGHKTGDKVLIELASTLEHSLRTSDIIARYGGEEFIVYLDNTTKDNAVLVANRLKEAIAQSLVYAENNKPVTFTVSIGVAQSLKQTDISSMIKMADDAMYMAKENGRNRVELYNQTAVQNLFKKEHFDPKAQLHPVFKAEDSQEISLLDGIESNHIIGD